MERRELAPGYSISRLIKGGWQLAGGHGAVDAERALADMTRFVDAGIDTFDCADIYTGVEERIGAFLARLRAERGPEAARRVRVHTKYVPDLADLPRLSHGNVERAIDRSLRRLGVERLDLVQFHWWDYDVPGYVEAALALDALRRAGKIRLVGATNFDTPRLQELLEAGVPVVAHQVQYSLVDRRPGGTMAPFCGERSVSLLAYGALLGGLLSERWLGTPPPPEPHENRSLTKYMLIADELGGWPAFQRVLSAARDVALRHGSTASAIGLRWVLDRPAVAAAIVGARGADHLQATLRALELHLDAEDRVRLDQAVAGARGPKGDVYGLERDKAGRHAAIMRYDLNARPR